MPSTFMISDSTDSYRPGQSSKQIRESRQKQRKIKGAKDSLNRSMSGSKRRINMSNTSETEKIVNGKAVKKERTSDSGVRKVPQKNVFY